MSIGRHPRDLIVFVATGAVVVIASLIALIPAVNPIEAAIYEQFGQLPAGSTAVSRVLTWVGSWAGVAVATAVALYLKRIRLGVQLAVVGALAWGLARVVTLLVGPRPIPTELLDSERPRLPEPPGFLFPDSHAAVAAAMAALAGPYLRPRYRNLAWVVAILVAAADVYLGHSLPLGAFTGVFVGWASAALLQLSWGAPGRRPSRHAVYRALEAAGFGPVEVAELQRHPIGPLEFVVTTERGDRLRVWVVRRLHRRAGPLYRLRRMIASLEVEDEPALTSPAHEAEHEAMVTLFAERCGLRTPPIVGVCEIANGSPLLVRRHIEGRRLARLSENEISEELLDAIWTQVNRLGEARIAHHDLRAKNILVDTEGRPWLLNLTFGKIGAQESRISQDVAETLVSLAALVGTERAVASAHRNLTGEQLEAALPYLQPLALPRRIRGQVGRARYVLTDLRETLSERIARPIPTFRSPVRPTTVIGLLLLGGAVYTLLPQLSSMRAVLDSLYRADWGWLVVAAVLGLLAIPPTAVSIMGSSHPPLPFRRTTAVQFAAAFTGRTTPGGIGFFGINVAFLERLGFRRARAVGVIVLNRAGTGAVGGLLTLIAIFGLGTSDLLRGVRVPLSWPVLLGTVAAALVAVVLVLGSPFGRRKVVRPTIRMARELIATLRHPVRATQLFGGAVGYLVLSGFGLVASLAAFRTPAPVLTVLAVFVVSQTVGQIVPVPGGLGAVETLMVAGLTAMAIEPTVAVAAVLTSRLLTFWLPVLPGIVMFRYLQHRGTV